MISCRTRWVLSAVSLFLGWTSLAWGQGRDGYLNVESPQVDSIQVATITNAASVSRRLLLTCNTPNNTVDVFDLEAAGDLPQQLASIPVGLEPVSVLVERYQAPSGQMVNSLFTANFLGDSVTYVELDFSLSPEGAVLLDTRLLGSLDVGDSPMALAFRDYAVEGPRLFVSKRTESSFAVLRADPDDFEVIQRDIRLAVSTASPQFPNVVLTFALKEPHALRVHPTRPELWVLGHQGGNGMITSFLDRRDTSSCMGSSNTRPGGALLNAGPIPGIVLPPFDLDICVVDISDPDVSQDFDAGIPAIQGIGALGTMESSPSQDPGDLIPSLSTTNFNMEFSADGDRLYVVGTRARSDVKGNDALRNLPTGFAETMLYQVDSSSTPVGLEVDRMTNAWDLNHVLPGLNPGPVTPDLSLAHVTDLVVGPTVPFGNLVLDQIWVTAFNSDNSAVLFTTSNAQPNARLFPFRTRLYDATTTNIRNQLRGPRSLAVDLSDNSTVYFMNRIEDSVTVLRQDGSGTYVHDENNVIALVNPEPSYIEDGRRFMYSTRFSGNGFVSCASCHIDGRSDQQAWLLDAGDSENLAIPFESESTDNPAPNTFGPKGHMITQSLQGLTNFEMNLTRMPAPSGFPVPQNAPGNAREFDLVSNAPYHWRGDKPTFLDFNEAFVNLQGMSPGANSCAGGNLGPGEAATGGEGLCDSEMRAYEEFVFSIHYEPNHLQPDSREYGIVAEEGLRVFHEEVGTGSLLGNRSCVQCHALPDGSNNRIANVRRNDFSNDTGVVDPNNLFPHQVLESTALRGLRQKEAFLELDNTTRNAGGLFPNTGLGGARSADFGLTRQGVEVVGANNQFAGMLSLNQFEDGNPFSDEVIQFLRQFDHSVAPVIGRSLTMAFVGGTVALLDDQVTTEPPSLALDALIQEVEDANAELVAYFDSSDAGVDRQAFAYDLGLAAFERSTGTPLTATELIAAVDSAGDRLLVQSVPLGSSRRIAGLAPSSGAPRPVPVGTATNEAYASVPSMTGNFTGDLPDTEAFCDVDPLSLRTRRSLLSQLKMSSLPGVPQILPQGLRHDAPRRLRFIAETGNFQPGTVIRFYVHHVSAATTNPNQSTVLELPIFETDQVANGQKVWETAIEFDPMVLYSLLAGGPFAPGVSKAWTLPELFFIGGGSVFTRFPRPGEPGGIDASAWNDYAWEAVGPQGTVSPVMEAPLVF